MLVGAAYFPVVSRFFFLCLRSFLFAHFLDIGFLALPGCSASVDATFVIVCVLQGRGWGWSTGCDRRGSRGCAIAPSRDAADFFIFLFFSQGVTIFPAGTRFFLPSVQPPNNIER